MSSKFLTGLHHPHGLPKHVIGSLGMVARVGIVCGLAETVAGRE
jgi:hypothetical protein